MTQYLKYDEKSVVAFIIYILCNNRLTLVMNRHFSRNMVEPNLPLRKPSSSPTHTRTSSTHRKLSGIGATGGKVPPSNLNVTGGEYLCIMIQLIM